MFHLYGPPSPNHSLFLFFVGVFLVGYLICSFIGKERTGGLVGHISLGGLNVCLSFVCSFHTGVLVRPYG